MAYQFHQFESTEDGFVNEEPTTTNTTTPQPGNTYKAPGLAVNDVYLKTRVWMDSGRKRMVAYTLCGALLLLLFIQLMVTGIKFSQLRNEISDIRLQLESRPGGKTSASTAAEGDAIAEDVFLERLDPVRGACKEGWWFFQTKCYLLSTSSHSWTRAEQQCVLQGGHLLVLNNFQELDYISRIAEIGFHYWIGLVERVREGQWSWVDGTNFASTPTNWDVNQPDNWAWRLNGEDCGQLHPSARVKRKKWNDADCSMSYRYICESRP